MKRIIELLFVLIVLCYSSLYSCSTIIVGKKASKDGSLLFGHNEDDGGIRVVNVWRVPRMNYGIDEVVKLRGGAEIPQMEHTWSMFGSGTAKVIETTQPQNL